eukprot:TRINITY_DN7233_c0_g1_i1.p2 TRINITY_DN7233_c0_g1~~TRINITY_DN7233_c0_g1_i1.p2  ORF type:complete len:207 (+),score=40.50 TRINITY_DN7233_c0_g1_i1:133-753(+)
MQESEVPQQGVKAMTGSVSILPMQRRMPFAAEAPNGLDGRKSGGGDAFRVVAPIRCGLHQLQLDVSQALQLGEEQNPLSSFPLGLYTDDVLDRFHSPAQLLANLFNGRRFVGREEKESGLGGEGRDWLAPIVDRHLATRKDGSVNPGTHAAALVAVEYEVDVEGKSHMGGEVNICHWQEAIMTVELSGFGAFRTSCPTCQVEKRVQ